jgi:hypothetical protein
MYSYAPGVYRFGTPLSSGLRLLTFCDQSRREACCCKNGYRLKTRLSHVWGSSQSAILENRPRTKLLIISRTLYTWTTGSNTHAGEKQT